MAYLVKRADGRCEIRESHMTANGPRSRTLNTFRGDLSLDVLARAEERAERPLDRDALIADVRAKGVAVTMRREERAARELLALLRRGEAINPVWVTLLRSALEGATSAPVPPELENVAPWIGESDARRGEALRVLLRLYDRIFRSRGPRGVGPGPRFPRFRSVPDGSS